MLLFRSITLILLLTIPLTSIFGQANFAIYQLYGYSECNGRIEVRNFMSDFWITNQSGEYILTTHETDNTIVQLPVPGRYRVNHGFGEPIELLLKEPLAYSDTIVLTKDVQRLFTMHNTIYRCCGEPCNSSGVGYYDDGSIEFKGKFRHGTPIDSLIEYEKNQTIKSISIHKKNKIVRYKYEENSSLESMQSWTKNSLKTTEYSEGKIISIQKKSKYNKVVSGRTFNVNGQLTSKQSRRVLKKFDPQSKRIIEIWQRKKVHFFQGFCAEKILFWKRHRCSNEGAYQYEIKRFNEKGQVSAVLKLKHQDTPHFIFNFNDPIIRVDWISSFSVRKDGELNEVFVNRKPEMLSGAEMDLIINAGFG